MKKIVLTLILGMFLISCVSAFEIDNWKSYDDSTKTVTINNAFGLGEQLAQVTLISNTNYCIVNCEANLKLDLKVDYENPFKELNFYKFKSNGNLLDRDLKDYEILVRTGSFIEEQEYEIRTCDEKEINCAIEKRTRNVTRYTWEPFNDAGLKSGTYYIKIKGRKDKDETIEWIPNFLGKNINEWATWSPGLNVGLFAYYNMSSNISSTGQFDLSNNLGTPSFQSNGALIGEAVNITTDNTLKLAGDHNEFEMIGANHSFVIWVKPIQNPVGSNNGYFVSNYNAGLGWAMYQLQATPSKIGVYKAVTTGDWFSNDVLANGQWTFIAITRNDSSSCIYINSSVGSQEHCEALSTVQNTGEETKYGGRYDNDRQFIGMYDEMGWWNRSLTPSEINDLYNDGAGLSFLGEPSLEVTLVAPADNTEDINITQNFNFTTTGSEINITNWTWYLWNSDNSINQTYFQAENADSSIDRNVTRTLNFADFEWNIEVCSKDIYNVHDCVFAPSNYSLDIQRYFENSLTYNTTTYEGDSESFLLSINSSLTPTNAKLYYNDTEYSATVVSNGGEMFNISRSLTIPRGVANNSVKFSFNLDGINHNSTVNYQLVDEIFFGLCNVTFNTTYLNISFKDEETDALINASIPSSSFVYYLNDISLNKTFNFINTSNNYEYDFCASPSDRTFNVDPYIQYKQGTSYPQRIWNPDILSYTNITTNQTLYLLGSADGIYVTFQVVNPSAQVLRGVTIKGTRNIGGTDVVVADGTTGGAGTATFWLNPDFEHTFTFAKEGFATQTETFAPTQTSYTITIGNGTIETPSTMRGISYTITPRNSSLINDTSYDFGFLLTSSYWEIGSYGFDLRLVNGTIITGGTTTISGTQLTKNYNVGNQTRIYIDYYWVINSTYTNASGYWNVYNTVDTQWSIRQFVGDFKSYVAVGMFGLDDFGRYLIIFLIIFLSVGIMSYKYGATNPLTMAGLAFGIIFFLDVSLGLIPQIRGINHLLTFVSGLILILLGLRESQK